MSSESKKARYAKRIQLGLCVDCGAPAVPNRRKCKAHLEQHAAAQKTSIAKLRAKVYNKYGIGCICCGETLYEGLTMDHILGNGAVERSQKHTDTIIRDIIREGFPKDKYCLLCFTCNCAKRLGIECPHKAEVRKYLGYFQEHPADCQIVFGLDSPPMDLKYRELNDALLLALGPLPHPRYTSMEKRFATLKQTLV